MDATPREDQLGHFTPPQPDVESARSLNNDATFQRAALRAEGYGYRQNSEFLLSLDEARTAYSDLLHDMAEAFKASDLEALQATALMLEITEDNIRELEAAEISMLSSVRNDALEMLDLDTAEQAQDALDVLLNR